MSDGHRGRASLEVKDFGQENVNARRAAVRSIAWLGASVTILGMGVFYCLVNSERHDQERRESRFYAPPSMASSASSADLSMLCKAAGES
jgi:hypothetical protein